MCAPCWGVFLATEACSRAGGPTQAESGQTPKLADCGPMSANFGQRWPNILLKFDRYRAKFGRTRPSSVQVWSNSVQGFPKSTKFGHCMSDLVEVGRNRPTFVRNQPHSAIAGQIWSKLVKITPNSASIGRNGLVDISPNQVEINQIWSTSAQFWANPLNWTIVGPTLVEIWSNSIRGWPTSARSMTKAAPSLAGPVTTFVQSGRTQTKSGQRHVYTDTCTHLCVCLHV